MVPLSGADGLRPMVCGVCGGLSVGRLLDSPLFTKFLVMGDSSGTSFMGTCLVCSAELVCLQCMGVQISPY